MLCKTYAINDIGASKQVFTEILFAQLYSFWFFCLQQPHFFVVADEKDVISSFITHFNTTLFTIADKSGNIYMEILDIFIIKLG